jgi:hypothetical protein
MCHTPAQRVVRILKVARTIADLETCPHRSLWSQSEEILNVQIHDARMRFSVCPRFTHNNVSTVLKKFAPSKKINCKVPWESAHKANVPGCIVGRSACTKNRI